MNELELLAKRKDLVLGNNPVLIQLLGLSPVLAVSSTITYGVGLGVATFFVCVLSCLTASLLRRYISQQWRLLWYMLILASYTTVAETLSQIYFYPLFLKLGIYLPLICCNIAILLRMETVSVHSDWLTATWDAMKAGLGFFLGLLLLAGLRELLISGTLFTNWQLLLPTGSELALAAVNSGEPRFFPFANTQAGVFLLLGMLVALINLISQKFNSTTDSNRDITPAKRARVTGRLSKQ